MASERSEVGGRVYGLLTVGGLEAAFSLELLREVIPDPGVYQPVPLPGRGLLGTIVLRELIVPVYDLGDRLGATTDAGADRAWVIAILVQGERVLGLRADGVQGLVRVPDADLQRLATNTEERPLFSACFHHAASGAVTSVLDGEAIFALPGIATTTVAVSAAERATRAEAAVGGGDSELSTIMLFQVGEHGLALDVAVVAMVLPAVDLAPSVLDGRICRGVTGHLGVQVPVVDPAAHTGLGSLAAEHVRQAVLLQLRRGYVALAITDMHAVVRVRRSELRPLPAVALAQPERFTGLYESDGRRYLVLDRSGLEVDPDLDTLSALNTVDPEHAASAPVDGDAAAVAGGASMTRGGTTYLTYDIGCTVATPLHEVAEIIGHPAELIDARSMRAGVRGAFVHRDAVVPLVDLAALLGPATPAAVDASSPVLLVPCGTDTVAFAVGALHTIDTSVWETAPDDPAASMNGAGGRLDSAPLIEIGADGAGRLVPRVSLVALAAEILGRPVEAPVTEVPSAR